MTIQSHQQKADVGPLITMYELDTTVIGGSEHFYFHKGTKKDSTPLVWQGVTYQPWPIEGKGFDVSTKGTLPRPSLQVGNVTQSISALLRLYDDLVGAKVIRRRTYGIFLDGQPGADPGQHYDDDIYFVEKKVSETSESVEFELASSMDLMGTQLPSRTIVVGSCPSEYRGPECSYAGTAYFNVLNLTVATLAEDVCSKTVTGCKVRFGARARLPFGGFPGARLYRTN